MNYEAQLMYLVGQIEMTVAVLRNPIDFNQRTALRTQLDDALNTAMAAIQKGT
jgi:hypothetical protein